MSGTVLITGATGFLGSWVTHKCLEAGYSVVGTVRDPDGKKASFLKEAMAGNSAKMSPKAAKNLKLVKIDLLSGDAAWEKVFMENPTIDYVIHVASPNGDFKFFQAPPESEIVPPAVQGTTSVMKAAKKHGVKRVVMTSSFVTMTQPQKWPKNGSATFKDTDWSSPKFQNPHGKAKTQSEKAAWEIFKDDKSKLCVLLLGDFMIGPHLYPDLKNDDYWVTSFQSGAIISDWMRLRNTKMAKVRVGPLDVRDAAETHLRALTKPCTGSRWIIGDRVIWINELSWLYLVVAKETRAGSSIPRWRLWVTCHCGPEMDALRRRAHQMFTIDANDARKAKDMFGINDYMPVQQTARDLCKSFGNSLGVSTW